MWPQTNFEKRVFIKMVLKLRRTKSEKDIRKEYFNNVHCTMYNREAKLEICGQGRDRFLSSGSPCKVNGVIEFKYTTVFFTSSCITNRAAVSLFWD